ncbi:MAG TPA: ABC transporter permease [Candidatus Didemnitutus sp.]|nr:ABC transporter permease [Candidatus Didemnitutus sp.]
MPFLRALFHRSASERDLQRELQHHLEREAEENRRAGMSPAEARLAAERAFGGVAQVQEEVRDAWGIRFVDHLHQDISYGLRGLRRNPGYMIVVILTLALGIGANTAIFSVVHGVLLRPLAYAQPDRLVTVNQAAPKVGQPTLGFSVPDFMDFRERNRAFSAMAEYHSMWFILLGRPEPERVQTGVVSDNFFDLLGVKPLLGRTFLPGEDKPGAAPVLVLSYEYWQKSFGGDPHVVGQSFEMNNKPHLVVGVLPPLPAFPNADQVFMPASACPFRGAEHVLSNRQGRIISNVFARLKDGVSAAQASDDGRRIGVELCGAFPQDYPRDDGYQVEVQDLARSFTGNARAPLFILLATSGFVLLIACANVANLALARLVRRDREIAVRIALGAGRRRIFRQLLTENLLLALTGGAAGLAFAAGGLHLLIAYASRFLPRADEISINGPVLLFTLGVSVLTGLLFGSRVPMPGADALANTLKDGARGSGVGRSRLRALLVAGQVAISVPLLAGAGLSVRSLLNLQRVDPGYQVGHVLSANLNLNWTRYNDGAKRLDFWRRAMDEAARIPAVASVAVSGSEPLNGLANFPSPFLIENQPVPAGTPAPHATLLVSSEDYFKTVGEPLLRGRSFRASDDAKAPGAVVINQSLASRLWPTSDPLGRRVSFDNGANWFTIVGIVANARAQLDADPVDEIQIPLQQSGGLLSGSLLVRTEADPAALLHDLREAIRRVDPQQPVTSIETLSQVRSYTLAPRRLIASLLGLFALVALVITATGIGGVLAFTVSQRTPEIGIRMALGASRSRVLWMVLGEGIRLVVAGLVVGAVGAYFLTRLMTSILYGVPPGDPLTLVTVVAVLLAVAVLACVLPARRATAVNPMVALRAS